MGGVVVLLLGLGVGFSISATNVVKPKHVSVAFFSVGVLFAAVSTLEGLAAATGEQWGLNSEPWGYRVDLFAFAAAGGAFVAGRLERRRSSSSRHRTVQHVGSTRVAGADPSADSAPSDDLILEERHVEPNSSPLGAPPGDSHVEDDKDSAEPKGAGRALIWALRAFGLFFGAAVYQPDVLGPLAGPSKGFLYKYGTLIFAALVILPAVIVLYSAFADGIRRRSLSRRGIRVLGRVTAITPSGFVGVVRALLRPVPRHMALDLWPYTDIHVAYAAGGGQILTATFDSYSETYHLDDQVALWVDTDNPKAAMLENPRPGDSARRRFVWECFNSVLCLVLVGLFTMIAVLDNWILPANRAKAQATLPELRSNVQSYSDAFLTGDVDGVVALLTDDCKESLDRAKLKDDIEFDTRFYGGKARPFATFTSDYISAGTEYTTSVSYSYPDVELPDFQPHAVENQGWRRENGVWKMDDFITCSSWEAH